MWRRLCFLEFYGRVVHVYDYTGRVVLCFFTGIMSVGYTLEEYTGEFDG